MDFQVKFDYTIKAKDSYAIIYLYVFFMTYIYLH